MLKLKFSPKLQWQANLCMSTAFNFRRRRDTLEQVRLEAFELGPGENVTADLQWRDYLHVS